MDPISLARAHHDMMKAQYNKIKEAHTLVDGIREEMDGLLKLGDMVAPGDVVKAAGHVVGKGAAATQIAELLATMPAVGGAPMAEWVRGMDQRFRGLEAQVQQTREVMQHRLGVAAIRSLAATHLAQPSQPPQSGSLTINQAQAPNQLQE